MPEAMKRTNGKEYNHGLEHVQDHVERRYLGRKRKAARHPLRGKDAPPTRWW